VFLGDHAPKGHPVIDRRLFLPEEWADDDPRREQAGVPEGVIFRTKPELALEVVADAVATGLPFKWVTGDSVYGTRPTYCQGVRALGKWYVLVSSSDARVWATEPEVIPAGRTPPGKGRPPTGPKVATKPERVADVAAADSGGGEPGAAGVRLRRGEGVVQRGGVAGRAGAVAGPPESGSGAGVEVPPE
jgi:SRSO17 transposase